MVERGLNVRDAEAMAAGKASRRRSPRRPASIDTLAFEKNLSDLLGLKVQIKDKNGKGVLHIHYRTLEQLEDVCKKARLTGV